MLKGIGGFFIVFLMDVVLIFLALNLEYGIPAILFIGIVQLIFVIPLCIFNWKNHKQLAQGMIIGASVVFMINSLCWGLLRGL